MYFQLLNSCILHMGEKNAVIYNLNTRQMIELDEKEAKQVALAERGTPLSSADLQAPVFQELLQLEWGFLSKHRYFIDKLRPYNRFTLTRPDLAPQLPRLAYLQLTNTCGLGWDSCQKNFCAPCRCFAADRSSLSLTDWKFIIDKLDPLSVQTYFLTGGNVLNFPKLKELCSYIKGLGKQVTLVINEPDERLLALDKTIPLLVYPCSFSYRSDTYEHLLAPFHHVTLLTDQAHDVPASFSKVNIKRTLSLSESEFHAPNLEEFYRKKDHDNCLYGKVFVSSTGNLVPCFQMHENIIGNLLHDPLHTVFPALAEQYWNKQTGAESRCSHCEWFYACPICKCMPADKVCPLA